MVIWLHRDGTPGVDPAWLRSRSREGRAVGVIGGTMAELWDWFGLGTPGGGWNGPGTPRPVFAMVHARRCEVAPGVFVSGSGATCEWFSLA
ncbi:MAG: hypothetical protein M3O34_12380 [Chloroflexota bacterium]|nr:hypothetical protein [Chloroflexota bacterium]